MAKKEELKPEAIQESKTAIELEELKQLGADVNKLEFDVDTNKEETFYKIAIEKLFDNKNIETKTEYLSPAEVFSGAKLQFLGQFADIPLLSEFVDALERKRISLKRKGREEIILALQERRQEEIELRKATLLGQSLLK